MKRILCGVLALLLSSCWRIPTDVNFNTDPRILRGTWTGTFAATCEGGQRTGVFSPDSSRFQVVTGSNLEVFNPTGQKLGGFTLSNARSPVAWSSDSSSLNYLRSSSTGGLERVVVQALTGAIQSTTTLTEEFQGTDYAFTPDNARVAVISRSGLANTSRISVYSTMTGALLGSKSISDVFYGYSNTFRISNDGNLVAYAVQAGTNQQVWVFDVTKNQSVKLLEDKFNELVLGFSGSDFLNVYDFKNATSEPKGFIRRIKVSDATLTSINFDQAPAQLLFSGDGTRVGYFSLDRTRFFVKDLLSNTTVVDQGLGNPNSNLFRLLNGANQAGTIWVISGSVPGCNVRLIQTQPQTLSNDIQLSPANSKNVTATFTPTYQGGGYSYAFTGTMNIGLDPIINVSGVGIVPNFCYSGSDQCERLVSALTPPIPYVEGFEKSHQIQFNYDPQQEFLRGSRSIVGVRSDSKKIQFYLRTFAAGETLIMRLDPPTKP